MIFINISSTSRFSFLLLGVKNFLQKLSTSRDGPVKSTQKGRDESTRKLSCWRKVMVKKDWKTTYSTSVAYSGNRNYATSLKAASANQCHTLALLARQLCSTYLEPKCTASLLTLDKYSGVRPIGIRENIRRIISKTILSVTKEDLREAAGSVQMCWEDSWC